MQILLVGDSHGDVDFMQAAIRRAAENNCSKILQLGDFGFWPDEKGDQFLSQVAACAQAHNVEVYVIDGNHDWPEGYVRYVSASAPDGFAAVRDNLFYVPRGHRWIWAGVRFGALGGAVSTNRSSLRLGHDWWPQERPSFVDLERLGDAPLDILVTHDLAAGQPPGQYAVSTDVLADLTEVRQMLTNAAYRTEAQLNVHGHLHRRYSRIMGGLRVEGLAHNFAWRAAHIDGDGSDSGAWAILDLTNFLAGLKNPA